MKNFAPYIPIIVFGFLLFTSCKDNALRIDTSDIQIEPVKLQHFERDLFNLRAANIQEQITALQKKYPGFANLFINNILCPNGIADNACIPEIIKFIQAKDMKEAYEISQKYFTDEDYQRIETALTNILKHYKYYFPEEKTPAVYTMISGFHYSIATIDSSEENKEPGYAIGLEMYLGSKNKFYSLMQIPVYKKYAMQKEFIPRDFAKALMLHKFPDKSTGGTLLNEMVYQGKILYLTQALLPDAKDSLIIGFSKEQLQWCNNHEKDIWAHLIENKFLYSNAAEVITKFTGEGPFTMGFVKESPARTGAWTGWNIVRKYMREYPNTTPFQLMNEQDAQLILSKSKYKP